MRMGRARAMSIRRYIKSGAFMPEAVSAMNEAFESVVSALVIGPEDDSSRQAVAKFIIRLARKKNGGFDASTLSDTTVRVLGGLARK
jgi:hypothetical protein